MGSIKQLEREIRKLKFEIGQRSSSVEVLKVKNKCQLQQEVERLSEKYAVKNGWLYVIEPYTFLKHTPDQKKLSDHKKQYMSCLGEEFVLGGTSS